MLMCWSRNPRARPTFIGIVEMLLPHIEHSSFIGCSFYHGEWEQMRALIPEPLPDSCEDETSPLKADDKLAASSSSPEDHGSADQTGSGVTTAGARFFPTRLVAADIGDEVSVWNLSVNF